MVPIPSVIPGYGPVRAFVSAALATPEAKGANLPERRNGGHDKRAASLRDAIIASNLRNGGTVSFHHHLRDGDDVLRKVMTEIAELGLRDLRVAATSIFPVHAPLVDYIRSGVVSRIVSSYIAGPVAKAISQGALENPAVLQTHGGRARAIESGELHIDVAFVAAPAADAHGNINGLDGKAACGPLGYPMVDARHAGHVIAITDTFFPTPLENIDILAGLVDAVVVVDSIGDASKIVSGTTRLTTDPVGLSIAEMAARVIEASGLLIDGFSFQAGAGSVSLAVAENLATIMRERGIVGEFASGGITGGLVEMFREGLFRTLFNVQSFDLDAVTSYRDDHDHFSMSASLYANPSLGNAIVNRLDVVVLGAAEVGVNFDVNVTAVNGGSIIGGSGGHSDTAAGAKLALVTTRLVSGNNPKIVDTVECRTTPGETIDVVVTDCGVAVNPLRSDLKAKLQAANIPVVDIARLRDLAAEQTKDTKRPHCNAQGKIVAVVEYRDGSVIDVVRAKA
ncbi:citrate lyase, alpha subunit (plasmid) [Rhizobium leguminosarum bv. trifolii WSM2304]|uniref:Citrate lyase alpha chain n=1 Tax=Rhizobium leguminosarum bv. trifolii (strain WSM2304) TaxID=395492 RepID=A0ABF7QZR4_RHILW|nr:citrate lyase subunit alpha [Rhizobium leguminosarum]ACI59507.1 citrate lyase, alpha subunit [Rhizobium leguminosarum bv. trifolii WSM2304]